MCGIVGALHICCNRLSIESLMNMSTMLTHRGPDDSGHWFDRPAGIALAHRRLSILDLASTGHQPMHSSSGRYVVAFNGEIYNYQLLREELEPHPIAWRGHSDTEVLLAAIEVWGLEETLRRCIGMFAIALWDRRERALYLARDRFGEKPLYYGWQGTGEQRVFMFGSELKALRAHSAFRAEIDREALADFMRYCYVPGPLSIYHDIFKLPPGTWLKVAAGAEPVPYWSLLEKAQCGQSQPFSGSDEDAIETLEHLLGQSIAGQRLADVPLGAFLSGGIDSSTIVALMQAQSERPVRTFTIGFTQASYNEANQARAVARHLGTDHTELVVTPEETRAVIPRLPWLYDEPFADSSQIPTLIVSELARRHVTVSLSGDGGDELFGGYNRHAWMRRILRVPLPLRLMAAGLLTTLSPDQWDRVYAHLPNLLPLRGPGNKAHKLASVLAEREAVGLYRRLVSTWPEPHELVVGASPRPLVPPPGWLSTFDSDAHRMMAVDSLTYLPDDILCKVDRAAMGVSLETRVPFLDHRVVEFAWSLPLRMKIRDGEGKWILRRVLERHVPRALTDRPKMGFGIPLDEWLRGPLRDWAEDLLDEQRLRQAGYLHVEPVRKVWREHLSGRRNAMAQLWAVLMFQAWLEQV